MRRILAAAQSGFSLNGQHNLAQRRGPIHGIRQGGGIPPFQQPGALALQTGLRQGRARLAPQRPANFGLAHRIGLCRQGTVVSQPRVDREQQRHCRALAVKTGHGGAVGAPQPDAYGPATGDPHRPAVAIAIAGAGLPGQPVDPAGRLAGKGLIRPPLHAQYLPDDPGRSRTQQGARHRLLPRQPDRHRHLSLTGQRTVERYQLLESNARRPQRNGWIGLVGEGQPHPGVVEAADQLVRPKRLQHLHRRHVEGLLQRLGEGHRPLKGAGKIGGAIVRPEPWRIGEQGGRVHQPLVHRQTVDKGLEGGAGGADRLHHVEITVAAQIAILGAAHIGAHRHGFVVHQQQGGGGLLGEAADIARHPPLQPALQIPVDGRVHQRPGLIVGGEAGKQRRLHRREVTAGQHRLDAPLQPHLFGPDTLRHQPLHHLVASRASPLGMPVRPVAAGSLRQHRQQRSLGISQLGRALAKVGKTCRLHPLQVAAKRRPIQIDGEQGALVVVPLQLQRARHLTQLAGHVPVVGLDEAGHLHGEGRAARHGAPVTQPLPDPAYHGHRIDPGMTPEVAILVAQQRLDIAGGDLLQSHGVAPHPAGIGKGAQRPPLHVEHHQCVGRVEWRRRKESIQR